MEHKKRMQAMQTSKTIVMITMRGTLFRVLSVFSLYIILTYSDTHLQRCTVHSIDQY